MKGVYVLAFLSVCFSLVYSYHVPSLIESQSHRRTFFAQLTNQAIICTTTLVASSDQASAAADTSIPLFLGDPPMIVQYPGLEFLVPIYAFRSALQGLESLLLRKSPQESQSNMQVASRIIDRFLSGGILSNKNVFRGMCVVYIQEIKYDDPDRGRVAIDKNSRLVDCDRTINGLVNMQKPLQQLVKNGSESPTSDIIEYLNESKMGLESFLKKIPTKDVEKVEQWIKTVDAADKNKNGVLEEEELKILSIEDQQLYKVVGELL